MIKKTGGNMVTSYRNILSDKKLAGYTGSGMSLFNLGINSLTLEQTLEEIKTIRHTKKKKAKILEHFL